MHEVYQSEQVILFDASSLCSDIDITYITYLHTEPVTRLNTQ
jgi:hypothetical protein